MLEKTAAKKFPHPLGRRVFVEYPTCRSVRCNDTSLRCLGRSSCPLVGDSRASDHCDLLDTVSLFLRCDWDLDTRIFDFVVCNFLRRSACLGVVGAWLPHDFIEIKFVVLIVESVPTIVAVRADRVDISWRFTPVVRGRFIRAVMSIRGFTTRAADDGELSTTGVFKSCPLTRNRIPIAIFKRIRF